MGAGRRSRFPVRGTLVASGVSILDGLEITARTAGNRVIQDAVMESRSSIVGETISEPLKRAGVFPPMVVSMIHVGEQTGGLDEMLAKIADFYDDEVDQAVEALLACRLARSHSPKNRSYSEAEATSFMAAVASAPAPAGSPAYVSATEAQPNHATLTLRTRCVHGRTRDSRLRIYRDAAAAAKELAVRAASVLPREAP